MNKNKEIEEMAKVMYGYICKDNPCEKCDYNQGSKILAPYCEYYLKAKDLYNAGYRQVKDKVVLDKEEYQNDFSSQFNKGYEKGSKEKAREILEEVLEFAEKSLKIYGCIEEVDFEVLCNELAREYGIEVE